MMLQDITLNGKPLEVEDVCWDIDPYCEVCGRVTDHVAEHDDLVDLGMCDYRPVGQVVIVDGWNRYFIEMWCGLNRAWNGDWWR